MNLGCRSLEDLEIVLELDGVYWQGAFNSEGGLWI